MLSCSCDNDDAEWFYDDTKEVAPLATKRMRRCCSCKERISVGDDCKPFPRWRNVSDYSDPEVLVRIYGEGGEFALPTWYLCDRCAGLYESLDGLGFCGMLGDNLVQTCREYGQMQRDAGVFRGQMVLTPNVRANRPSGAATGVAMTDKVAGPDGSVLSEGLGPNAQTVERWYCVSREGMATLCVDEEDARANAAHCDQAWRAGSPHRAVRLVDAPRWVPVSEALPPEHVTCAVRMQGDYIATAWAAYWHGARTDFGRWVFPHDSDEDCADKITHWLALPTVAGLGA